jgi:hypothetical protein
MNGHLAASGSEIGRNATQAGVYALLCSTPAFQGRNHPFLKSVNHINRYLWNTPLYIPFAESRMWRK